MSSAQAPETKPQPSIFDYPDSNSADWHYTFLNDAELSTKLSTLAHPETVLGTVDCISFQPNVNPAQATQDRHVVKNIQANDGVWKLRAIFDGHAGHETADYILEALPPIIETTLQRAIANPGDFPKSNSEVSNLLVDAIVEADDRVTKDILELFPSADGLAKMSDDDVQKIINDDGKNLLKVHRGMRGTTVLVSLINPKSTDLWVASLGDCQAILGGYGENNDIVCQVLSSNHNGTNVEEADRIRKEHPGEEECVKNDRVLGSIAVTRAVGDHLWKLPRVYTEKVFLNARPGYITKTKVQDLLPRILTPPYMSSQADIQHVSLSSAPFHGPKTLILCSDGLTELYKAVTEDYEVLGKKWIGIMKETKGRGNKALTLLRDSLGGGDVDKVSRKVTGTLQEKWMDDVTILVEEL